MQVMNQYPAHASGGSCFVFKEYDGSEGVINTGVEVDAIPYGALCLSAKAVRAMADLLGYDISPGKQRTIERLRELVAQLQAEVVELREAGRAVLQASELLGLLSATERAGADVEAVLADLRVGVDDVHTGRATHFELDAEVEVPADAAEAAAPAPKAAKKAAGKVAE